MSRDLRKLERVWRTLGRDDPFWAALTDSEKRGGGWEAGEFFRTGEAEIDAVLQSAVRRGVEVARGRALDFGCGAGRLTQALAARFDRADGVDISASMIALARQHNRFGERCKYHRHVSADLALFRDSAFDFIYSAVTLQHIPPDYSRRYIREFVRVLAPDGLLVFQLPSHRGPAEPMSSATRTRSNGRLPRDAFSAAIHLESEAREWMAGETRLLHVSIRNEGRRPWPAGSRDDGAFRVQVGNRWRAADGALVVPDDGRTPMPHDVAPGQRVTVFLEATAPLFNGEYLLELDMVQEHVSWFRDRGSRSKLVPCHVSGGQTPPPRGEPAKRFSQRHPRVHAFLVKVGLNQIRGGVLRHRARVRAGRWQRSAMVMHSIPRSQVVALLEDAGARVLQVDEELTRDGYQSCRYWVGRSRTTA
jgi:SAM-dependent methyltransferase